MDNSKIKPILESEIRRWLRCPACATPLHHDENARQLHCESSHRFPIVDDVPVLIDESSSLFDHASFESRSQTFFCDDGPLVRIAKRLVPPLGDNLVADENYARMKHLLLERTDSPKVLILGGSIAGSGLESLLDPRIETVDTDISLGPRARMIVDAHQIPFADGSFDGVVAQAVLEHVIDPFICVNEIHRVLKPSGLVYVEIPFMQQVHGGRYDFMRFTQLGMRKLMNRFEEIDCGAAEGPGMVLSWSLMYFLLSFSSNRAWRAVARVFSGLVALPLRLFDKLLVHRVENLDSASGFYFLGRRSDKTISDRRIVASFKSELPPEDTQFD